MRAGKYRFPDRGIEKAANYVRQILKTCPGKVGKEVVADALGMSATSGAFFVTLASLSYYGLAEVGAGKVAITDSGKKIRSPNPSEVDEAKTEAIGRIEIFKEIYKEYGANATEEQLRVILREKGGVERLEAEKKAPELLKVYKEATPYLKFAEHPKKPTIGTGISRGEIMPVEQMQIELRAGEFYQKIPYSIEGINMAKSMLDFLEKQISKKESSIKKELAKKEDK